MLALVVRRLLSVVPVLAKLGFPDERILKSVRRWSSS